MDEYLRQIRAPLWLAHHHRDQLERCVLLPIGRRPLAICARCLGLYPTLFAALALQIGPLGSPGPLGVADWLITLGAGLPGLVDWGLGRLGRPGSNAARLLTGVGLGLALGRGMMLHFLAPLNLVVTVQLLVLGLGALGFEIAARRRRR